MKFLKDLDLSNKRVLIRADLNVPFNEKNEISDDNRIRKFLPTIQYVLEHKGFPIVMSHLGDSNGKVDSGLTLKPVAEKLASLTGHKVVLSPSCVGPEAQSCVEHLCSGEILLLENLRFHAGEKENSKEFAQQIAKLGDLYINDAFATAHRSHASIVSLPRLFKESAAGLLMQTELEYFDKAFVRAQKPLCIVLGGAKVSSKINALKHLASKADKMIIGGAMANTFLAAQGLQMGRSLVEHDLFPQVFELLGMLARKDCKLYLPVDVMVGPSPNAKGLARAVPALEVPADQMALDIGPATSLLFKSALHTAETIIWNGPMGACENEDYSKGTTDMIEHIACSHGMSVVGGGDTDAAIHQMELAHKFDYISTGGGAFLALLEGKPLPGIAALE